ncbi:unnamed protein product [Chrysodeixis includens]|uniref:C2H2-type domain-containing protein n=1 Tax=Chrysodeixis includens TaxID=689277 RepID=A0A9P0FWS7_CHRIL|nr:unnamed protein product [Chrysodeixis includens]
MPPTRRGRPPGSKNKKKKKTFKVKSTNEKIKYVCNVCYKKFPTGKALISHRGCQKGLGWLDMVGSKAAFSCKKCSKKFTFMNSFTDHLRQEHSELPDAVECDQCNVRCPDKETLVNHIQKFHERQIFNCPKCGKKFVRRAHVLRHMAQSGCNGKKISPFVCEVCNAKFSRKDNLMVHIRLQHIMKNKHNCKSCSFGTKSFSKLANHWHKFHSDSPDQYQCDHCGSWTSSRAAMIKHLEIHGEKKYSCAVCGYTTYTIEVMQRHVFTHVNDKPYKCTQCDKSYIQRAQLQRHLAKHDGNVCPQCEQSFDTNAKLMIHMREHYGLEQLYCPIKLCTYSKRPLISEASFMNHLKMHIYEKQFKCDVCTKSFHSEPNLKRHLETHALHRPRRCMYCVSARAYVRGEQLLRHVRKLHPHVFKGHLQHVRQVLGSNVTMERVKKSEMESILNLLDVEAERILQGYGGSGVLYGGMQEDQANPSGEQQKGANSPLMSEEELTESLQELLSQLIDKETLELFGWPDKPVDVVLEKVITQCGAKPADRDKWTRVQRLRENSKHLFLYVIEDKNISRMLDTHTIDQIVKHILKQVSEDDSKETVDQ